MQIYFLPLKLLLATLILTGCATGGSRIKQDPVPAATVRALPMFDGHSGESLTWPDLLARTEAATVIIVGELHDDRVGHAVQRVLVQDVLEQSPDPSKVALTMEMLDRTRQATVDDYLADLIDRDTFLERTATTKWRKIAKQFINREINRRSFERRILGLSWPDWEGNYQPTIDAAKDAGARVIAANTPWRRYTSLANQEGYARLDDLTPLQQTLFTRPEALPEAGPYRERFWEVMVGRKEGEPPPSESDSENEEPGKTNDSEKDDSGDDDESGGVVHPELSDDLLIGTFRAQYLMDTTMARSIADAVQSGSTTVIHLVGSFHSDFNGGTVQQLKNFLPGIKILTLSMEPEGINPNTLREEDRDRADIIIYTTH